MEGKRTAKFIPFSIVATFISFVFFAPFVLFAPFVPYVPFAQFIPFSIFATFISLVFYAPLSPLSSICESPGRVGKKRENLRKVDKVGKMVAKRCETKLI